MYTICLFLIACVANDFSASDDAVDRRYPVGGGILKPEPVEGQIWSKFPDARFSSIPGWMTRDHLKIYHYVDDINLNMPGNMITLSCPEDDKNAVCDVYFFVYHCPPCSHPFTGGFPGILASSGWQVTYCAPQFVLKPHSEPHQLVGFRKQFLPGEVMTVGPSTKSQLFVAVAATPYGVMCPTRITEEDCNSDDICKWIMGACESSFPHCQPSENGCGMCADQEI
eukprot:TRINITY_DN4105_c2_g1_i1.p1 TRINITY_DN4105_c2_g1~~TRINITY_DN4105_c2_g1_i1.p1  ORF type:complete len:225 (+),score=24.97 TRINITY_DN4105_c2_g1_i1:38-712(+)